MDVTYTFKNPDWILTWNQHTGNAVPAEERTGNEPGGKISRPGYGVMQIRKITVPKGAHPRQLVLNAIERRLKKLPNFNIAARRDAKIGGHRAATVTGTYSYQGNLQYPVAIEEVHVVTGREAFILHFECFQPESSDKVVPELRF